MAEKFYDVPTASQVLGLKPDTMRRWLRAGRIRGVRLGRDWRISERAINELAHTSTNQQSKTVEPQRVEAEVDDLLDATGAAAKRAGYHTDDDIERLIAEVRAELGHDTPRHALRKKRLAAQQKSSAEARR